MSAYVIIVRQRTTDAEAMAQYRSEARAARSGRSLTPVVFYGDLEVLEGTPVEGVAILHFPTTDAARAWYISPAYQAARAHRLEGSESCVYLVEGVDEGSA